MAAFDDGSGVVGVLDHPELPVDEDWTQALPTPQMRRAIAEQIDALFGRLAAQDEGLSPAERRRAARCVVRFLASRGSSAPAHLDSLPAPLWKLASCKLFCTCDGRWLDLRVLAGRVHCGGIVPVVHGAIDAVLVRDDVVRRPLAGLVEDEGPFVGANEGTLAVGAGGGVHLAGEPGRWLGPLVEAPERSLPDARRALVPQPE